MRVLVVEDHERLAHAVAEGLRREGMAVDLSLDGADALAHVAINRYDVVVLDRDLPAVHGDLVCRKLVQDQSETRVLMLTASSTISDRVQGLELGADDYLPKPLSSPSWWLGSARWVGGPFACCRRSWSAAISRLTRPGASRFVASTVWY